MKTTTENNYTARGARCKDDFASVIDSRIAFGGSGHIVLALKDNGEYATWWIGSNGDLRFGHYFDDVESARDDFILRG